MLMVSRKKLLATRVVMWGGLILAGLGIVISFASTEWVDLTIALLAAGLCVSLLGAAWMRRLFRCPFCKQSVLPEGSGIDIYSGKCPDRCPHCGTQVRLGE